MKLSKLYSRSTTGKVCTWEIEINQNKYRTISGFDGMKLTTSEWTTCDAKSYCTAEEQALKEATAIHRKKMETGSFEDINQIDNKVFFEPMLAKDYTKEKVNFPVYSQPKLDGIRCIVRADGMWSRTGKRIISAPHIFESMKHLFEVDPNLIFDGELYADKFANDFNAICSLVKKTKPTEHDLLESAKAIQYHIYDLPSHNTNFSIRIGALNKINLPECCVVVLTDYVETETELMELYGEYVNDGYEGQMVRLDNKYENKRSKYLLKHKSFVDDEYTILGVKEGIGKLKGKAGALIFEGFESSINGNHKYLEEIWNRRDELIGKEATVKYFNLTPDGQPRFPKVINIGRGDYE
ncbi:DNA ligase [uncultured Caudovirales phage]|uniref:DNA ligase n=1 Tax=uncultured Caudovirales phage TaxID=2100421 RepID=A0A6J5LVD3_9CAUD|nr:DNA ligase [uncultured Caudovirales phage]